MEHQRQTLGQQVCIKVVAGSGQTMTRVTTEFDGFTIGDDPVGPGTTQYERTFEGQDASNGASHKLVVTAFDQTNNPESAIKFWTDPN
jgi:hypothetical protein